MNMMSPITPVYLKNRLDFYKARANCVQYYRSETTVLNLFYVHDSL